MIYYISLVSLILLFYIGSKAIKNEEKSKLLFCFLVFLLIVLFQGFRSFNVGIDLKSYIPAYDNIARMTMNNISQIQYQNFEIGYILLNKLISSFGFSKGSFLVIISILIQGPILFTIYKYSENSLISILWYLAFGNFIMTFSGLRQALAMGICFFAYGSIKNKNIFKFILIILFASLFHKSALFCLILYPIYYLKLTTKHIPLIVAGMIGVYIVRGPVLSIVSSLYFGEKAIHETTGAYTMLFIYILIAFIAYICKNQQQTYLGLRNVLLVLICIYMFAPIHSSFTRIGYPITLYITLFIPKLLRSFKVTPKYLYYGGVYVVLLLCFFKVIGSLNTLPFSFRF